MIGDELYRVDRGDCIELMADMDCESVDFSVFSPPFPALYAYTSEHADIGNSESDSEMRLHLGFFYRQLARIIKPGRVCCVHVMQIPRIKRADQGRGVRDFRGLNIRIAERSGLVYEYDWCIRKNPQSQAIRTKSRELQFSGLESDRSRSRGALADYILKFTAPGQNEVPIVSEGEISRNQWIEYAECTWQINETDTLNVRGTKGEDDTKHICALQLPVIDRLVRLFTNPGEIVFSPFAGIGSEGYIAVKRGRRFYGIELKPEYHQTALLNLERAERMREADKQTALFPDAVA